MGSGDPKKMTQMAEPEVLLDAIEGRVPDEPELRRGLAELIFHGSLESEFRNELRDVERAARGSNRPTGA